MSTPAESPAAGGGNTPAVVDSRLGQPNDAVPMRDISQGSASPEQTSSAPTDAAGNQSPRQSSQPGTALIGVNSAVKQTDGASSAPPKDENNGGAPPPPVKERRDSIIAIGPAQDGIGAAGSDSADSGPVCNITLLLTSGSRHPYKIDGKYLNKRNVIIPEDTESGLPDPFSISVYTLKELILREWRSDWEAKPASPSSIRLIHFGKLLDDKEQLKKYHFGSESPNVVHMSIRPQDLDEEEPRSGGKNLSTGGGDGSRSRSGGGCCVIL